MAEELEGCSKAEAGPGCHISSPWMVGPLGLGQVAESVHRRPLTFLLVKGVGPTPAAAKWGFLFSCSGLVPTPFLFIFANLSDCV